jgi:hypothetical protein
MEIKGVTFPAWERIGHPSMFILSASLPLWRVDGEFPGFSGHTLLTCEVAENKVLMDTRAHSVGTALGLGSPVFDSHSKNQF